MTLNPDHHPSKAVVLGKSVRVSNLRNTWMRGEGEREGGRGREGRGNVGGRDGWTRSIMEWVHMAWGGCILGSKPA